MLHPGIAFRDCNDCLAHLYNEETGKVELGRDRKPRKRDASCPPPCRTSKGCPKGTPEEPESLSEQNERAYLHYKSCVSVGMFPEDSIVRQNATIIRIVEDAVAAGREAEFQGLLLMLTAGRGVSR